METQSRIKSPLFWVGLVSAVYTAVVSAGGFSGSGDAMVDRRDRRGAVGGAGVLQRQQSKYNG